MLEVAGCRVTQGEFTLDADWSLATGASLAVVGPSGAGKSTLLAAIAGFVPLTKGEVRWQGQALASGPADRPVAMLFQEHNLFPHLTIGENVGLGLRPGLRLTAEEADRVENALAAVGLDGFGPRRPADLSGGQRSRAALARITVMARPLVLLDEPFSALGPGQRADMLGLVQMVARSHGSTLIVVTHDLGEAETMGGHVSFVDGGRAAAPVPAARFFADPPQALRTYAGRSARG